MAGQVLKGLWPLLFSLLIADAVGLGSISVSSHGTSGQLGSFVSQYAPGFDRFMRKLGLKSEDTTDSEDSEEDSADEERREHRKLLDKWRFAEEGKRLQEEYYRKETKDRQEIDDAPLDTDDEYDKRFALSDGPRHGNSFKKLRRRLARTERRQDDEDEQGSDVREGTAETSLADRNREGSDYADRDRDHDTTDDGYSATEDVDSEDNTRPSRRTGRDDIESLTRRRSELDNLSDMEIARKNMHSADEDEDEEHDAKSKRRGLESDEAVEDDGYGSDSALIRRERAHRRHDDKQETSESDREDDHRIEDTDGEDEHARAGRSQSTRKRVENEMRDNPEESAELSEIKKARASRDMKEAFSEAKASRSNQGLFKVGETVKGFHNGMKQWQSAKIQSIHDDGSMTVNWESGSNEHRQVNAQEVAKVPVWGSDNPYRFEGPHPYDVYQEQQNKLNGHAMAPSTKTNPKEIFDGYTLFTPSEASDDVLSHSG